MTIRLSKLKKYFVVDKLIVHSIDLSLYQASAIIREEHYITDERGVLLVEKPADFQKQLAGIAATVTVLRHTSAYDEMVGGPEKGESNA